MAKKLTLQQILRKSGIFSSKEELVNALRSGKVAIDGRITKNQEFQCNPNTKEVTVNGKKVNLVPLKYFVLNKEEGFSCQLGESYTYARDLIEKTKVGENVWNSLFCVGRLDVPTTGLLIITNDGDFSRRVLSPDLKVWKKYKVFLKENITDSQIQRLENRVKIELKNGEEYNCQPAIVNKKRDNEIYLSISEGKFRQIRKMIEAVGNSVVALQRVAIGKLELGDLHEGMWKEYSSEEIKKKVFWE